MPPRSRPAVAFASALALSVGLAAPGGGRASAAEPPDPTVVSGDLGRKLDEVIGKAGGKNLWGAVLVAKEGKVLLAKGYGFADYEARPNRPDTLFEIASASKQVTATAILRLEQQKKLATTDSILRFFPKAPKDKKPVTVQHLLNHTAGLDPSLGVPYSWTGTREPYARDMLERPLVSEPGEKFAYSNVGYALLAAIVEEASGKTFEEYCRKELFSKAGLTETGFVSDPDLVKSDRVSARRADDTKPEDTAARWFYGWGYRGMGGVVTTVLDLHKWDRALRTDRVLGEPAKAKLHAPALESYACGWKVETTERGTTRVHHSGGVRGYACQIARWLDEDAFVAILSNGKSDLFRIEAEIVRLLFPPARIEVEVDAGSRSLNESNAVASSDGPRLEARGEGSAVVVRLLWDRDALATIRLPKAYAGKVAADVEAALAGRDDLANDPAMDAGIYLGAYAGAKKVRLDENVVVRVLPRYPGSTGVEEVVVFLVDDQARRFWPVMAKMNGAAAKALLEAVRKAL